MWPVPIIDSNAIINLFITLCVNRLSPSHDQSQRISQSPAFLSRIFLFVPKKPILFSRIFQIHKNICNLATLFITRLSFFAVPAFRCLSCQFTV